MLGREELPLRTSLRLARNSFKSPTILVALPFLARLVGGWCSVGGCNMGGFCAGEGRRALL